MSGQVILYFEDQADALRFALAAGSVMAGDGTRATDDLVQETARVTRIRLDAANKGKTRHPNPPERVAQPRGCRLILQAPKRSAEKLAFRIRALL
jgi:hypothetical protein